MVTNVSKSLQSVRKLVAIYSQRWLIEIAFRAWKQAGMIAMAIGMKTGLSLARSKPNLRYSLEKIFDYIITRLVALRKLTDLTNIKPDLRHLQAQKRNRISLNCNFLELIG